MDCTRCLSLSLAALLIASCATKRKTEKPKPTEPLVEKPAEPAAEKPVEEEPAFVCEDDEPAPWPMFQHGPDRHGVAEAPAIENPTLKWSQQIGIAGWLNNPVIAAGTVYAPSSGQVWNKPDGSDGVYAFALEDGEQLWFRPLEGDVNAVAYAGCRLFVTGDQSGVTALDARTGEILWNVESESKVYVNPLPGDGVVYVAAQSLGVVALSVEDGAREWEAPVQDYVFRGGLATDGVRVYATMQEKKVGAFDAETGEPLWLVSPSDGSTKEIYAAPTVDGRRLYVSYVRDTAYRTPAVIAFDTATGDELWSATNSAQLTGGWGNIRSSPALWDGRLYWGEPYSNRVISLEVEGGDVTNSYPAGACTFPHWPSPAIADGIVYVPRHDGGLYAFDTTEGTLQWKYYLGDAASANDAFPPELTERGGTRCSWEPPFGKPLYASPAIANDGTLLVSTGDGWLHALGEKPATATTTRDSEESRQ